MIQPTETLNPDDKELIFAIILIDVIYLIAFAERYPTERQVKLIEHIREYEPTLQNSKFVNEIIADSLEDKLSTDYTRTANRILMNMSRIVSDQAMCEKIYAYAQEVALMGDGITPNVQNLLDRIGDALFL